MEWNNNDWQGKKKNQVESTYKILGYVTIISLTLLIILMLFGCKSTKHVDCDAYSKIEQSLVEKV